MSTEDRARSWAASKRFGAFAIVFGTAMAVFYVLSDMGRLPLFTYHPGTGGIDFGWVRARRDEGPAMYWYGWIATSSIGAAILGAVAAMLPERIAGKIPAGMVWVVPVLLVPVLIYSLRFYWRW